MFSYLPQQHQKLSSTLHQLYSVISIGGGAFLYLQLCIDFYFFLLPAILHAMRSVLKQPSCWWNMERAFTLRTRRRRPRSRQQRAVLGTYSVGSWRDDALSDRRVLFQLKSPPPTANLHSKISHPAQSSLSGPCRR